MAEFSVLMSVYAGEIPAHLDQCLASVAAQTRAANEVVLVKDGPLGEGLETVIASYFEKLPMSILQLGRNSGLGPALRAGVERCRFDLIARMDSDDIARPERFQRQIGFMEEHPDVDVLGAGILEFNSAPADGLPARELPERHEQIVKYAKLRSPVNHPTAVLRKRAVMAAGNYSSPGLEDYDLWVRMLLQGSKFHNMPEHLVYFRTGGGMYGRRGGWWYLRREHQLLNGFRKAGFLNRWEFTKATALRLPVRILPVWIRALVYRLIH